MYDFDLIADVKAKPLSNDDVPAWAVPLVQQLFDGLRALGRINPCLLLFCFVVHLLIIRHIPLAGVGADVHNILYHTFPKIFTHCFTWAISPSMSECCNIG